MFRAKTSKSGALRTSILEVRSNMRLIIAFFLLLLASTKTSYAIPSVQSLDQLPESAQTLSLKEVGSAKFSVLFWDIYQSKLFTSSGSFPNEDKEHVVLFEIEYLRDISKGDLIDRTIEQWQHIGLKEYDYQHYLAQLEAIWPDIVAGDKLSLLIGGNKSSFFFNQRKIGTILEKPPSGTYQENSVKLSNARENNSAFGKTFIDIWLSEKTSQPKLRQQLLGKR